MKLFNLNEIVDLDVLNTIQDRFAKSTGLAAVTVDYAGTPITSYSNFSPFCNTVRKDKSCLKLCNKCDSYGGLEAARSHTPYIYKCHLGLVDFAIPIVLNGHYLGSIMSGQVKICDDQIDKLDEIMRQTEGIIENADIKELYDKIPVFTFEKIEAAAQLMFVVTNHIVEKGTKGILKDELHSKDTLLLEEIRKRTELEELLKDTEIRALQSEINPHFMFNILNTVGSLALIEKANKTQDIVHLVAELLRYIVKNSNQTLPVYEEIMQVKRYLKIQSIRYGSRLKYNIKIDDNILTSLIPAMILQPFVENSIIHGIELKESGYIEILGYPNQDDIVFEIIDNGIGMSNDRDNGIVYTKEKGYNQGRSSGIGISNVNKRLLSIYGNKYKVNIKSQKGGGTTVIIKVPINSSIKE
ncbi:MAG: PocR ligand-binding domain-containing protein [Clostridiaceae bacterium]